MHPRTAARLPRWGLLALLAAAPLLAASLATTSAWAAPPAVPRAAPAPSAVRAPAATTTAPTPHTIYLSLSHDIVTMPSTLRAGTYYVQVRTTDASSGVTVVRPPSTLTPSAFYRLYQTWIDTYNAIRDPGPAFHRYRTSATFVGGASTTKGQVGAFAIRLNPGRYFFFAAEGSDPRSQQVSPSAYRLNPAHIKVVTVLGPAPAPVTVPVVGVARFAVDWTGQRSVTLPSTLPRQGFLLAVGGPGLTGGIAAGQLVAGTTDAELYDGTTCITEGGVPASKRCFTGTWATMGGAVSPGASAWFYYRLPAGDYAVGSDDHNAYFDRYFGMALVQRVHVS